MVISVILLPPHVHSHQLFCQLGSTCMAYRQQAYRWAGSFFQVAVRKVTMLSYPLHLLLHHLTNQIQGLFSIANHLGVTSCSGPSIIYRMLYMGIASVQQLPG